MGWSVRFNETEGATDGKILTQQLALDYCTTLTRGRSGHRGVEQLHRKAHRRSDPTTRQWPRYHCRSTAALERGACEPAPSDAGSVP